MEEMVDDQHSDPSFDRYARLVRRTLGVPTALVSIVEASRQVFPGAVGLPEPWQSARETPLTHSFCQYVVADRRPLLVSDARLDPRLADNLAIPELGVVAYAGWPLVDHHDQVVGSLCAIDSQPRTWTDDDLANLSDLAAACSAEIAARERARFSHDGLMHAEHLNQRSQVLLGLSEGLADTRTLADVAQAVHETGVRRLGCTRAAIWRRSDLIEDADPLGLEVARLHLVTHPAVAWGDALDHAVLAADDANPVGDAFLRRRPTYYADRASQDRDFGGSHRSGDGGQARAFLPLKSSGALLGILVLMWPDEQDFDSPMRATLTAMATYAAAAVVRAALLEERLQVVGTLQQAMLSSVSPLDDIDIAVRYRPAADRDQVGGDWYDVVRRPSGTATLTIGDVVGHDIEAAAAMGELRHTLRALAWSHDASPARGLALLDRALPELGVDTLATAFVVDVERAAPDDAPTLRWSSAGHPPALMVDPHGIVRWLDETSDVLLGVYPELERYDTVTTMPAGTTLLLYTDGLVERRGASIDDGFAALATSASTHAHLDPEAFVDAVLDDLLTGRLDDDVAVLVARLSSVEPRPTALI